MVTNRSPTGVGVKVSIARTRLIGADKLIRDQATGRTIDRSVSDPVGTAGDIVCLQPITYESPGGSYSCLTVGDTAYCELFPPTIGWYRVMHNLVNRLNGRLVISSLQESTDIGVDLITTVGNPLITTNRASLDNGANYQPWVTKARAGSYHDAQNNYFGFLEIYVARVPGSGFPIVLAHPL